MGDIQPQCPKRQKYSEGSDSLSFAPLEMQEACTLSLTGIQDHHNAGFSI